MQESGTRKKHSSAPGAAAAYKTPRHKRTETGSWAKELRVRDLIKLIDMKTSAKYLIEIVFFIMRENYTSSGKHLESADQLPLYCGRECDLLFDTV